MKTSFITTLAALALIQGHVPAASPVSPSSPARQAVEFDASTGKWKPAGPKPVVKPNAPPPRLPWTAKRLAMQPLRLIVILAKIPLIPAGMVATNGAVGLYNAQVKTDEIFRNGSRYGGEYLDFVDFGPALQSWDPGAAIDADLFPDGPTTSPSHRSKRQDKRSLDAPPVPFQSDLKANQPTTSSANRKPTTLSIAYNTPAPRIQTAPRATTPVPAKIPASDEPRIYAILRQARQVDIEAFVPMPERSAEPVSELATRR